MESAYKTLLLNPAYTLEGYMFNNKSIIKEAVNSIIDFPGEAYNPLFIYGAAGMGKTHLLQAITHEIIKNNPRLKVFYTTIERLIDHLVYSIQHRRKWDFIDFYQNMDLLLVDDIHFLKGKQFTQEELFLMLDSLYSGGKQIVISADRPPNEIFSSTKVFIDKIRRGSIAELNLPNRKDLLQFLYKKAMEIKLGVPSYILEIIVHRFSSSFRKLESILIKIKFRLSLTPSFDSETILDTLQ